MMRRICNSLRYAGVLTFCLATTSLAVAQQTDSSIIQPDGTAIVTRIVPVPKTISPEAQRVLARQVSDAAVPQTLADRRTHTDEWQNRTGKAFQQKYPVTVQTGEIAGVPVRIITPLTVPPRSRIAF